MRIRREIIIGEHEIVEGIFGHNVEEEGAPETVEGGPLLKDERDHRLDVDHLDGLSMKLRLLGVLVLGKTLIGYLRPSNGRPSLGGGCFGSGDGLFSRLLKLCIGLHGDGEAVRQGGRIVAAEVEQRATAVGKNWCVAWGSAARRFERYGERRWGNRQFQNRVLSDTILEE
jgi:hypothetical protein